ncbi:hypothetical protein [Aliarcobacter butzleri]|uniref:hypothetical protein n=1 Tax=Aliarcobacter butzleri TaxID=28197 RepID=UPI0034501A78
MSAKTEIERRLRTNDYKKMSKELFNKSFDTLSNSEYVDILKIADIYGSKYKRFYKLKPDTDIKTLTSNLTAKPYNPSFSTHNNLNIIGVSKTDNSFIIYTEFYTNEQIWKEEKYGESTHKIPVNESFRRVMVIEKESSSNYAILSIDPIGLGSTVYKKIDTNIKDLNTQLNLDFNSFFDTIEIDNAMFKLIDESFLIPQGIFATDESTKRVKSVQSRTSKDNIKDEEVYKSCINSDLKHDNIKMKLLNETIELFEKTLIKISTNADKGKTDELTTKTISVL